MPRYMKTPFSIESRHPSNAVSKNFTNNASGKMSGAAARNTLATENIVSAAEVDLSEVMRAIRDLEKKIDGHEAKNTVNDGSQVPPLDVVKQDQKIDEIRTEISEIAGRIQATKLEIAALRHPLSADDKFESATEELAEIVRQTERATDNIMAMGEKIEEIVADLLSLVKDDYANSRLGEIGDLITGIYESCNFQDLTGQRITKVVKVLNYIEERVDAMMATWDIREFKTMPLPEDITRKDDDLTLSGPMMESNAISQADIDAMFD